MKRKILLGWVTLYLIGGTIFLIKKELISVDHFIAAAFCLFFLWLEKRYSATEWLAFMAGLTFFPHILGTWGLYEWAALNYHYDMIVHLITGMFSSITMMLFMRDIPIKAKGLISLSITVMIGAIVEASEYWGFIFIGFGSGYLGFGSGDNSQNFGPWENSSIDTTLNFAGALLGLIMFYLISFFGRKNK